jgi:hypothetical protein
MLQQLMTAEKIVATANCSRKRLLQSQIAAEKNVFYCSSRLAQQRRLLQPLTSAEKIFAAANSSREDCCSH